MAFAHCAQNFARGGFSAPHDGHLRANGVAHSMQNFALSGFSIPHFEQCTHALPGRSCLEPKRII
jgi:hypothetical protein